MLREKVRVETGGKSGGNYLNKLFFKIIKKKFCSIDLLFIFVKQITTKTKSHDNFNNLQDKESK